MTRAVAHGRGTRRAAPALTLQVATRSRRLPALTRLRRWARAALAQPARVTLRIVGEPEGESLNREFRREPRATNVLTFCYDQGGCLAGDIVRHPLVQRVVQAYKKDA